MEKWKKEGFIVIKNVLEKDLVEKAKKFMDEKYNLKNPPPQDFGSVNGELQFPSNTIIDKITLHPKIIQIVEKLLNTREILLTQSDAWSKMGVNSENCQSNQDQRMHMDYGNHTFLHPPNFENPEVVAMIVYLSDTKITGGGTAYVRKTNETNKLYEKPYINMPGQNKHKFINDKKSAEIYFKETNKDIFNFRKKLYENEEIVMAKPGDILVYRLDVWHRGTPVKKNQIRHVVNLAYKKKECYWINQWNSGWTKNMYYGKIETIFKNLTPRQREILGIPAPGDKYWNTETIRMLTYRYPGINITPYVSKL